VHTEDYSNGEGSSKKLGTLDEHFVQRLRAGQVFALGTRTWEFLRVDRNRVHVRHARDEEELLRLIHRCGELSEEPGSPLFLGDRAKGPGPEWLQALRRAGRVAAVVFPQAAHAQRRWIAAESAPLYQRAFGPGLMGPMDQSEGTGRTDQAKARRAVLLNVLRGLGPMAIADLCSRYGLPARAMQAALRDLLETGELQQGDFVVGRAAPQVCTRANLEELHRLALAALRLEREPVALNRYVDFLLKWQHLHPQTNLVGPDAIGHLVEQQAGLAAYPRVWERAILSLRVKGADPREVGASVFGGELQMGQFAPVQARQRPLLAGLTFVPTHWADELVEVVPSENLTDAEATILGCLRQQGPQSLAEMAQADATGLTGPPLECALWRLFRAGLLSNTDYASVARCIWTNLPRWEKDLLGEVGGAEPWATSPEGALKAANALRRAGLRADAGKWYAGQGEASTQREQRAQRHNLVANALLEYAVRWGQWEAIRLSHVDGQLVADAAEVVAAFGEAGYRLGRGMLSYRLRKRVGAEKEETARLSSRPRNSSAKTSTR